MDKLSRSRYSPPMIVERTAIGAQLNGVAPSHIPSAVFRSESGYEAPAIVGRTTIDMPLVLIATDNS